MAPRSSGLKAPREGVIANDIQAKIARKTKKDAGDARGDEEWLTFRVRFARWNNYVCARDERAEC